MAKDTKIALVTGANRGLGLEACRQLVSLGYQLVLTSRDEKKGRAAAEKLGSSVVFHPLDVAHDESVQRIRGFVEKEMGRLDVLINNAGILPDRGGDAGALSENTATLKNAFETNVCGPFRTCQAFFPLMKKNGYGRIVNVSSRMGQLSDMNGGWPAYRISKTALNAVTRIFAAEAGEIDIKVNSICPGWVKTDMGGAGAELSIEEGVDTMIWAATLPLSGPNGSFLAEREIVPW